MSRHLRILSLNPESSLIYKLQGSLNFINRFNLYLYYYLLVQMLIHFYNILDLFMRLQVILHQLRILDPIN